MKHSEPNGKSTSANSSLPELKRAQSVKQMIKTYREQQNAIKEALGNLDKKPSKKIIFDEDDDYNQVDVEKKETGGKKKSLFQSDDEEEESYDFEMKDHFMGKEGQQLLQLQSKFKGDTRFKLDERFIESEHPHSEGNAAATTELSLEEEKKNEIDILQEVLGTKIKSNKPQESSTEKHMLRYDPTQSHHVQYEIKPSNNKKKTNKKQLKIQEDNNESGTNQQPNVSKDVFYQVKDDLKDTFQSQQTFSLLSSFGNNVDEENDEQMEEEPTEIKNSDKLYLENNPFQYDSSEDELENLQAKENKRISDSQLEVKFISEPFFFKDDDFRLQEGSDFVKRIASESNSEFGQQRRNLKHIVKAKVRNNTRKNNPFKKKLGGNKKKKIFRIRKALKR